MRFGRNMTNSKVFFLHGFLGSPKDTQFLFPERLSKNVIAVNLMDSDFQSQAPGFENWVKTFYKIYDNFDNTNLHPIRESGPRRLIGYSLGGRLALHLLKARPDFWDQVILISANTGFDDSWQNNQDNSISNFLNFPERQQRWKDDQKWAEKFLTLEFTDIWNQWNQQSFFKHSVNTHRENELQQFDRKVLAHILIHWSLAFQCNMRPTILENSSKIISILGSEDLKYRNLWEPLCEQSKKLTLKIIPKAAHRIFLDNPIALKSALTEFLLQE